MAQFLTKYKHSIIFSSIIIAVSILLFAFSGSVEKEPDPSEADSSLSSALEIPDLGIEKKVEVFRSGDNLATVLGKMGSEPSQTADIVDALKAVLDLRRIHPGTEVISEFSDSGLTNLTIQVPRSPYRYLVQWRTRDFYYAFADTLPVDTVLVSFEGEIESSLYETILDGGGNPELAVKFMEIFQFVHYFSSETRKGDSYRMVIEEYRLHGERLGYGLALAAQYVGNSGAITAVWRPDAKSEFGGEYFDEEGLSLRRDLLRAPFPAAKLTSTYGMRRHPVKGGRRMHNGLDFGAPAGTPIVASGSGTIVRFIRNDPGFGNWIEISHGKTGFKTRYAHMRGFARGMRKGKWVKQGEVIGYVGMTGTATGNHLHYETFRDGKRLNPMKVKGSPVQKLRDDDRKVFLDGRYYPWKIMLEADQFALGVISFDS